MRKLRYVSVITLFFLVACTHNGKPDSDAIINKTNQLIELTKTTCQFVPTVSAIAAIFAGPAAPVVGVLAQQICEAIIKLPQVELGQQARDVTVNVDGKPIPGLLF